MFSWIKKGRAVTGVVGIENRPEGIAIAHVCLSPQGNPQLLTCEFLRCAEQADRAGLLSERIDSLGLKKARCNMVLSPRDYSLQLSEAPKVEPSELREAIRWRIKDQIPMPLEEAVIDVFSLPIETGRSDMVYTVAAHRQKVDANVALASSAGLALNAIDITELALRNLNDLFDESERSVAVVWIEPGQASINLIRSGNLYLARKFDIAWSGGLFEDLPADALTLELQRSLDYFERQMRQAPPQHIYLCGEHVSADKITATMRDSLSAQISILPIEEKLPLPPTVDTQTLQLCLSAIGAALRTEEEAAQ